MLNNTFSLSQKPDNYFILLLLVCCLPLFFLGIYNVHNWGDDFSQYLKEADNISKGLPFYQSPYVFNETHTIYGPPQYPPGYPLLIAPLVKIFGIRIAPLLVLNTVFVVLLVCLSFALLRKFLPAIPSFCAALIMGYNPEVLYAKCQVLSDLPGAVFTMAYLVVRASGGLRKWHVAALIFLALFAALIRTQLLIITVAEIVFLIVEIISAKRKKKGFEIGYLWKSISLQVAEGVGLGYLFITQFIFPAPQSANLYYAQFWNQIDGLFNQVSINIEYLVSLIRDAFYYKTGEPLARGIVILIQSAAVWLFLIGLVNAWRAKSSFTLFFFSVFLAFMLVLPVHQGFRFMLPVLPLVMCYTFLGGKKILAPFIPPSKKFLIAPLATFLLLVLGIDTYAVYTKPPVEDNPYTAQDRQAFQYLQRHVADSSVIVFFKPRALALFTGKKAMTLSWELKPEANLKVMREKNARYLLIRKKLDDGWYQNFLSETNVAADSFKINEAYTLYSIQP